MALTANLLEKNDEAIVFVSNLDQKISEELLWELFVQAGPVLSVFMPRDKITGDHQGYGFVEFKTEVDADYAIKILHLIKLYNRPIKITKSSNQRKVHDIGANIFIGNLDIDVDEKRLYDAFSTFGPIINAKVMRDPVSGVSKGFGFVSYDNFESSDKAVEKMHNQFFSNKIISVEYGIKKGTKGERHGSAAERLLAANRVTNVDTGISYGITNKNFFEETPLVVPKSLMPKANPKQANGANLNNSMGGFNQGQNQTYAPGTMGDVDVKPSMGHQNSNNRPKFPPLPKFPNFPAPKP